jgi:uroporphyrinogen decarboxylase
MTAPMLKVLAGETLVRPPVWFMRQAGRYLPEYRAVRATAPDFIAFCLDPEKAVEVTLQPLRRYPYDAAIVFADILLVPMGLGQKVWFEAGEGPRLGPLPSLAALEGEIEACAGRLSNVGTTLSKVRAELPADKALIGFAGAPWTVATYMLQGKGGDREHAKSLAYQNPKLVDGLLDILVEATARYLAMQAQAGAQVLKLFDSWADGLPEPEFHRIIIRPHQKLMARLRQLGVETPVIGFPRGAGPMVEAYAEAVPVQAVALDTAAPAALGKRLQTGGMPIQGALDPLLLRAGGPALDARVDQLIDQWGGGPYIFNLGHGILPDTPMDHVARVLERITGKPVVDIGA